MIQSALSVTTLLTESSTMALAWQISGTIPFLTTQMLSPAQHSARRVKGAQVIVPPVSRHTHYLTQHACCVHFFSKTAHNAQIHYACYVM